MELFHYTTRDFAEEVIVDLEGPGVAAEIWDGNYGPGFYALDLGPDDASREDLRWECFGDARPEHPMDGVLVLDSDVATPGFERQASHIWLMPGRAGQPESIGHLIIAVGVWERTRSEWDLQNLG